MAPGLIGRRFELAAIERLLDRAADRRAGLVIQGEPGIGRSALVGVAIRTAAERGYTVLSAAPTEAESRLSLSGLGDLFLAVAPQSSRFLPTPQRRALEVALLLREPGGPPTDQRTLSVAATTLLRALTVEHPVLVTIDDAQWLDVGSERLVTYALRRLGDRRIGLLVSRRGGEADPRPFGLDSWTDRDRSERIVVGPLSVAALHQLLADRIGHSFSRLTMVRIHAASGGNPFYALEIGQAILRTGEPVGPTDPLPVPETLAGLTRDRIRAIPGTTREALQLAAIAIEPPTIGLLERSGVTDPARVLRRAIRDGVIEVTGDLVRFTHPLLASAVVADAGPERIRACHRALRRVTASEEARARHAAMATTGPDARVADALDAAAGLACLRGAPIAAAQTLELASELTPPRGPAATDRLHRAAACYLEAGEARRAAALLERLASHLPAGSERARSLQLLGQVRMRSEGTDAALALTRQARAEIADGLPAAADIELDAAFYSFCLGDLAGAATHAHAALAHADRSGLDGLRAEALAAVCLADFRLGRGMSPARMSRALALEDPTRHGRLEIRPRFVQAQLLLGTGDVGGAKVVLQGLRAELIERGQDTALPALSLPLVIERLWRGDAPAATRIAEESIEAATLGGEPLAMALALSAESLAHAFIGNADRCRLAADAALVRLRRGRFETYVTWPIWALALLELSLENVERVDGLLRPLADRIVRTDAADPILGLVLPEEIEALASLGDLPRARRYLAWLERRGRALDRPWALAVAARSRGIVAAAAGRPDAAIRALETAIVEHRRLPIPFELGRTLLIKGQVHRRRREKRPATDALEAARRLFEEIGVPVWAARASRELARVGLRPRAPTELTATERRVAELAASGLTNRLVAHAAFLAPKTVDNVLGRVYRKLGISSRAQLGALMATAAAEASIRTGPTEVPGVVTLNDDRPPAPPGT